MLAANACSISRARSESRASASRCSACGDRGLQRRRGAAADGRVSDAYGDVSHWRTRLPIASASPFL